LGSRNGEEVKKNGSSAAVSVLRLRETLEISIHVASSKRRPLFAVSIYGQMVGHAMVVRELLLPPSEDLSRRRSDT
jgi:hypothetical protein